MVYPHNKKDDEAKSKLKKRKIKKEENKTIELDIPDPLVNYLNLKYHDKWVAFNKYAEDHEKFITGFARLLEILATGDEQDKIIFGLVPLSFLSDFNIETELDNGKILGSKDLNWKEIEFQIKEKEFAGNQEEIPDYMMEHMKQHPFIKKAFLLFGGKITKYWPDSSRMYD